MTFTDDQPFLTERDFAAQADFALDGGNFRSDGTLYTGDDDDGSYYEPAQHLCDYDCLDGCTSSPANPCVDARCDEHWPILTGVAPKGASS
jgi:hypothetical protein